MGRLNAVAGCTLYNNQLNPRVTGSDGYFAFFTPPGQYYLQVDGKPGYQLAQPGDHRGQRDRSRQRALHAVD